MKHKRVVWIIICVIFLLGMIGVGIGINKTGLIYYPKTGFFTDSHTIVFSDVRIKDKDLLKAAKGKTIHSITIENCELAITDKTVWREIVNEDVSDLIITGCSLTDQDVHYILANATNITTLDFADNMISDASFLDMETLVNVNLSGNKIARIGKYNLVNLRELRIKSNRLKDLDFLETAVHLQALYANDNQLESIEGLKNCTILTKIHLKENHLEDVSVLQNCQDIIRELNLGQNRLTDLSMLVSMPDLTRANFDDNSIDTLYLASSVKLKYLSARNNKIDSLTGSFEKLEYIDLANNQLSGDFDLSESSELRDAFLENNHITSLYLNENSDCFGNVSVYNNPLCVLDIGSEYTDFDIYLSYRDELKETLEKRFCPHLYLLDCPQELRVPYEAIWNKTLLSFPEQNVAIERVEELRKEYYKGDFE